MATRKPAAAAAPAGAKRREEIGATSAFLNASDPVLAVFDEVGVEYEGVIQAARMVNTEFQGTQRKRVDGKPKQHLQVMILDEEGTEILIDVRSQNQKEALRKACASAGVGGLARGDYFRLGYTHDDAPLREDLSPARGFDCEVRPAE